MIGLLGYNFYADINCADPSPTVVKNVRTTKIGNGIFNKIDVDSNTIFQYTTVKPTTWDYTTILDADFENNINAGNISTMARDVTSIRVKRRIVGEFEWITLDEVAIDDASQMSFSYVDRLNLNFVDYEYAFVPVINDTEGTYITKTVYSEFNGVYICDADTILKLQCDVKYGDTVRNQQVGVFTPFGRQYPIVISNGAMNYDSGSISGLLLNADFYRNGNIDRYAIAKLRNTVLTYLSNKRAKVIKDWNGNAWLVYIIGNPSAAYVDNSSMMLVNVSADWVEIGDASNKKDLYQNAMIPMED